MMLQHWGALALLLFSAPTPAKADFCVEAFEFVKGAPTKAFKVHPHEDGSAHVTFLGDNTFGGVVGNGVLNLLHPALKLDHLAESMLRFERDTRVDVPYFVRMAEAMKLRISYSPDRFAQLPAKGPLVVFANHPLSGLDGLAIAAVLSKIRTDVKILANKDAALVFPGFAEHGILVDKGSGRAAKEYNLRMMVELTDHVRKGGAVVMFPAGRVSRFTETSPHFAVYSEWRPGLLRLIDAVPESKLVGIYVRNQPSDLYLALARHAPKLAHALVPSEIAKGSLQLLKLELGIPVDASSIGKQWTSAERLAHLRKLVYDQAGISDGW